MIDLRKWIQFYYLSESDEMLRDLALRLVADLEEAEKRVRDADSYNQFWKAQKALSKDQPPECGHVAEYTCADEKGGYFCLECEMYRLEERLKAVKGEQKS